MENRFKKLIFTISVLFICAISTYGQSTNNQIIVKINYSYLNFDVINDKQTLEFSLKRVLNDRSKENLANLENQIPGISEFKLTKIFPFLSTFDTVSISRIGQKVTIPPFWATFTLSPPKNQCLSKLITVLNNSAPLIEYCHYDFPAYTANAPNDTLYFKQISLNGSALHPNSGINIEDAWEIQTGKSFIKVGVHDSGIDTTHPDIQVAFGGAYFEPDNSNIYEWGEDTKIHGTPVAGIIGAKRNNETGIAGIAGGDTTSGSGCSLIDLRVNFYNQGLASFICASVVDAARFVGSYWEYPIDYYDTLEFPSNTYFTDGTPGFGVHISNHSYVIKTNASIPQDPTGGDGGDGGCDDDNDDDDDDDDDNGNGNGGGNGGGNGNNSNLSGWNKTFTKEINDSTVASTPICSLCREAFLFSLKNGVINVAARGNSQHFSTSTDPTEINYIYPQSFPDNWIISVGASGYDGYTVQQGLNQSQFESNINYWSLYGGNMDLIAPGSDSIVYSTHIVNSSTQDYPYLKMNGTSAAAPHVSGVTALLLSHYNKPNCYSNRNLSIEDVEYILENSATNLYSPGYDDTTGWGRLDAYKALQMIENPTLQIIHPDSLLNREIISIDTISLKYENAFVSDGWGPISRPFPLENNKYYKVKRVLVRNTYSFEEYMTAGTQLLDVWSRPSASNALDFYEEHDTIYAGPAQPSILIFDELDYMPFQNMVNIDTINYQVKIEGYYYHFIGKYDETFFPSLFVDPIYPINEWLPVDPINVGSKMLFSIYIKNDSLTSYYDFPCDSTNLLYDQNLSTNNLELENSNIILYPNPSNDFITIKNLSNYAVSHVIIRDLNGKIVFSEKVNSKQINIDVSFLQKGAYFADCIIEGTRKTLKLIKL